jgi:hypothetical protein
VDLKHCEARHAPLLAGQLMVVPKEGPIDSARGAEGARSCSEHCMSDDAKLGLILLFMVFALMVIGPVLAG